MIKGLVRISLVIWIALMPLGVALAQEEAAAWGPESIAIPKAVLRKVGTGQRVELPVEVQVDYLGNGNYLASYTVRVPQRHLAPDNVDSRQDWDPTYAVLVTIEQYYWAYDVPGGRAVSVDKYRARWNRYDGTVSWRDANMWAACYGWDVHWLLDVCISQGGGSFHQC